MSEEPNPFAPPTADFALPAEGGVDLSDILVDAGLSSRFVHFVVDNITRFALGGVVGAVFKVQIPVVIFVMVGYYVAFEMMFGRTPAKWLTGTRVVTTDGKKPRFLQILGRTLCRYVPFEPLSFLFSGLRGWHDSWSNTRVVYDK